MATQTRVIGPISAYAIAVQEGYTGSKADWAEAIGNAQANAAAAEAAADRVQELTESLPDDFTDTIANFAPTYSTSGTYNVGDYVIHYGSLYRCITKITTAEAWTPIHWTQVSVGEDLKKTVWHETQNLTQAQRTQARNNIDAADQLTVSFHTTQIGNLESGKQDKLTFDSTPTAGSNNPVTSAGIKAAVDVVAENTAQNTTVLNGNYAIKGTNIPVQMVPKSFIDETTGNVTVYTQDSRTPWQVSNYINVTPGDIYVLNATMYYQNGVAVFYDSNDSVVSVLKSSDGVKSGDYYIFTDYEMVIPDGVAKVRIGVYTNTQYSYSFGLKRYELYGTASIDDSDDSADADRVWQAQKIAGIINGNYIAHSIDVPTVMTSKQLINQDTGEIQTSTSDLWLPWQTQDVFDVTPGETYYLSCTMYYDNGVAVLYNSADEVVSVIKSYEGTKSGDWYTFDNYEIAIPSGVSKARIGVYTSDQYPYSLKKKVVELYGTASIDDNAGANDKDRVWSADKTYGILNGNYFDSFADVPYSMTVKRAINVNTGEITSSSSDAWLPWQISNQFEVSPGDVYYLSCTMYWNNGVAVFYDTNDDVVSVVAAEEGTQSGDYYIFNNFPITIPNGVSSMRFGVYTTSQYPFCLKKNNGIIIAKPKYARKKWVVIGDSLTEKNIRTTRNYFDYISEARGFDVVNLGISGTGYRNNGGSGINEPFYARVSRIPTDADIVTIFGSFNDGITDIGTATDTGTTTVGGCVNTTLDNLYSVMPTVQLGIVSPTPWRMYNPYNHPEANGYADLLESICKMRSIPFLNLYYESNLRPWDPAFVQLAYSKDAGEGGIHPDETGHAIIAPRFEAFVDTLLLH